MRFFSTIFCAIFTMSALAEPTLVPTEALEDFLIDNNVSYQEYPTFDGVTADPTPPGVWPPSNSYLFLDYPDPDDNETLVLFFEIELFESLSGSLSTHLAAGIRGPSMTSSPLDLIRGRGISFGQNWVNHPGDCQHATQPAYPKRGYFIEDFTAAQPGNPADAHLTFCDEKNIPDSVTYRIDLHVSNIFVSFDIWMKTYYNIPFVNIRVPIYTYLGSQNCLDNPGPSRSGWKCPDPDDQHPPPYDDDEDYGNGFILVYAPVAGLEWRASNIFMANIPNY